MSTSEERPADVCVVGGGLIGLCTAFFLDRAGLRVQIVEKDVLGSGAGRHNAGMIVRTARPMPAPGMVSDGLRHMFSDTGAFYVDPRRLLQTLPFLVRFAYNSRKPRYAHGQTLLDLLNARIGETFDVMSAAGAAGHIDTDGVVFAFSERDPAQAMHDRSAANVRNGGPPPGPVWSGAELAEHVPILGSAARWAVQLPSVRWVDPSTFMHDLLSHIRSQDIAVTEHCEVLDLREVPSGVELITTGPSIAAERVIVCAGPWTDRLMRTAGRRVPITPGKGYSFSIDTAGIAVPHSVSFPEPHVVSVPLIDRRLRLAGTMEFDGLGGGVSQRRVEAIIGHVRDYLSPSIDWAARTDVWAGPRPMTADGVPHLGPVDGSRRVFVAAGHNMEGLTLGPATGSLMADLVTGKIDAAQLAGLRPGRRWS